MWIEVYKKRYSWKYKITPVEVYSFAKKCYVIRNRNIWQCCEYWKLVKIWVGKHKYQKKPGHAKKVLSEKELNKKSWRESKRVTKDKAKREDLHGYHSDGCPVWMKRLCNKKHRQWERRCIEREAYDQLGQRHHKRKDIFDPWLWS